MEVQEKRSKKRPTIQYYKVPAVRRLNSVGDAKDNEEEFDGNNNCLDRSFDETWDENTNNNNSSLNRDCVEKMDENTNNNNSSLNRDFVQERDENINNNSFTNRIILQDKNGCQEKYCTSEETPKVLVKDVDCDHKSVFVDISERLLNKTSRRHRQISVDLSSLKNIVHRHINVKVLSHSLQKQIRMNKFLSWHKPSELKVLFKAYKDKDCLKEEYLQIIKIVMKDILMERDVDICAEFCSILLELDSNKDKGDRHCIQTFLTAIEDLIIDYNCPLLNQNQWSKFLHFLAQLFFFTEEKISICSLYLLPLISHALSVTNHWVK